MPKKVMMKQVKNSCVKGEKEAIPIGFEPMTYCLEGSCSIQLSYGICFLKIGRKNRTFRSFKCYWQLKSSNSFKKTQFGYPKMSRSACGYRVFANRAVNTAASVVS